MFETRRTPHTDGATGVNGTLLVGIQTPLGDSLGMCVPTDESKKDERVRFFKMNSNLYLRIQGAMHSSLHPEIQGRSLTACIRKREKCGEKNMGNRVVQVLYVIGGYYRDLATIDESPFQKLKASSEEELLQAVRAEIAAQAERIVERIATTFEPLFITELGQKVCRTDLAIIEACPSGHGAVVRSGWRATHAEWEIFAHYHVPAGSLLPDGQTIREGELVHLRCGIWGGEEQEKRDRDFFRNSQNTATWVTVWKESE